MKRKFVAGACTAVLSVAAALPVDASPAVFRLTIPLHFGGRSSSEPAKIATAAEVRAERRLRLARYGFQIADAIISVIGYRAYAKCLSCLAYPGGGPLGSASVSAANFSGNRPAEINPLIAPFSRGGIAPLALGTLAYDIVDARIEKHWSIERRESADIAEIAAHAWGISTWVPEIANIHRDVAIASACGAQWRARQYGEAFSNGCVNAYYRPGPGAPTRPPSPNVLAVCAPARFTHGTYLFATSNDYVVSSGTPCTNINSPFR